MILVSFQVKENLPEANNHLTRFHSTSCFSQLGECFSQLGECDRRRVGWLIGTSLGEVPREQNTLKDRLPRVVYHQVYQYTKKTFDARLQVEGILLEAKNHLTRGHDNVPSVAHTKYFMQSLVFQEVRSSPVS